MPKLTRAKRTAMVSLAMTGAVIGATQTALADSNNLDDLHHQLDSLVKNAERVGLKVIVKDTKVHESKASALTDIKQEATRIQNTIAQVENVNKLLTSKVADLEKQGIKFDGVKTIEIDATNVDDTNQKLAELEAQFKSVLDAKSTANQNLEDAVKSAQDSGVIVEKKGTVDVPANQLSDVTNQMIAELKGAEKAQKDAQEAYQKALADWEQTVKDGKAKVESDYMADMEAWNKEVSEGRAKVEKAYQDAVDAWNKVVSDGHAKVEKEYQDAVDAWNKVVSEGRAKVEKEYQDALDAWNARVNKEKSEVDARNTQALAKWEATVAEGRASHKAEVDKINRQNEAIRQQNKATEDAFKNAVASLSTKSTATKVGEQYQQTIKQTVTADATAEITIVSSNGANIDEVELTGPNGYKKVLNAAGNVSNKVYFNSNDLAPGEYTLTYKFKSTANNASDVNGSFTVQTADKAGMGSGSASFTTKAPVTTNTANEFEPLTTVHVYDYSSSYAGKVKDSLRLSKKIIEANENPQSKHILQLYPDNYSQTSYHASGKSQLGGTKGISSTLLSKQEALDIIDKLLAINAPTEANPTYQNYPAYFQGLADAMGTHRYIDESATADIPFEDIVEKITKPADNVSVIQYTDGWMDKGKVEEMDRSFATWAKGRAKTFMSVVNRNQVTDTDTNSMRSIQQMQELGHPNIYDMTGKDPKVVDAEVINQFMETATVKVKSVKGENQTAHITLGGDGVTVTKAVLKGGGSDKNLAIKDGRVDVSEKLPDGEYVVEFEATGNGNLNYQITVDGKTVHDKTVAVAGSRKGATTTEAKTDNFEPVEKGKLLQELPMPPAYQEPQKPQPEVYVAPEKPTKGEYKEPPKPIKGEYQEPPKPTKGEYKEPPQPTKGEYKEPEKPKAPENKHVDLKQIQVVTEKPELKVKDIETHKVSVKPQELPKTGAESGITSLFGLGSLVTGLATVIRKRRRQD